MTDQPVLIETRATTQGQYIGILTLNSEKSLNALSIPMCQAIAEQLTAWQHDSNLVAIVLRGSGEKAFCAGGDIRKLYESMVEQLPSPNAYAKQFFGTEYRLYRQMHFYPKPIILWANGFVMGGGMGLMSSASHRIVTEKTRFAMPEVSIGLFPDATGSWFLQRLPAKAGLFLGLTGVQCNASDALVSNLAEFAMGSTQYEDVLVALSQANWQHGSAHDIVNRTLAQLDKQANILEQHQQHSNIIKHARTIQRLMDLGSLADIHAILSDDDALLAFDADFAQDEWVKKAVTTYRQGCPVSYFLTAELYRRVRDLSLEQVLYLEAIVATKSTETGNFQEGVRALLIDKDRNPNWTHRFEQCLTEEGQAFIQQHFVNPYPTDTHPLQDFIDRPWGNQSL